MMIKLFKNLKAKDWWLIGLMVLLIVPTVYLELQLPDYMKDITSLVESANPTMNDVYIAGAKMLGCALGSMILSIGSGIISAYVAADLSYYVREKLFNHVTDLSNNSIKSFSVASLITRSTNDITQIQTVVAMGLSMLIKSPILAIWAICKIINKSWQLSLLTAGAVVLIVSSILIVMFLVLPRFKIVQKLTDNINRIARENITGVKVVRAFNAEQYEEKKFNKENDDLVKNQLFNRNALSFLSPIMSFTMSALSLGIYWIGAYLLNSAGLLDKVSTFSDIIVFGSYATYVVQAFMLLTMICMMLPRAEVSARRINEVLVAPIDLVEGKESEGKSVGTLEFKNVSYHYDSEKNAVSNLSFSIKKGQTVAIVGATGCGKTTLVSLAARLFDPSEGEVLLDDRSIKDYTFNSLYQKVGFIPQKAILFSDTVKNNITFGVEDKADEKDVKQAIKISQSQDFVDSLPEKENAPIAEAGTNLSGGQKQRLTIARALARKPEILIFDDSFSALDYATDKKLREDLKSELKGTTCLIVAQRIGTIENADNIIVLDHGQIVGQGTHQELLENCDVYKEIASSQLSKEEISKGVKVCQA